VSREVREVDQLKKKTGVESAHRKRMAQQGGGSPDEFWRGEGVSVLEQRLDGVVGLRRGGTGWGARAARV
jgi:hypothetical protein